MENGFHLLYLYPKVGNIKIVKVGVYNFFYILRREENIKCLLRAVTNTTPKQGDYYNPRKLQQPLNKRSHDNKVYLFIVMESHSMLL